MKKNHFSLSWPGWLILVGVLLGGFSPEVFAQKGGSCEGVSMTLTELPGNEGCCAQVGIAVFVPTGQMPCLSATDPSGNPVTIIENSFCATEPGTYTVTLCTKSNQVGACADDRIPCICTIVDTITVCEGSGGGPCGDLGISFTEVYGGCGTGYCSSVLIDPGSGTWQAGIGTPYIDFGSTVACFNVEDPNGNALALGIDISSGNYAFCAPSAGTYTVSGCVKTNPIRIARDLCTDTNYPCLCTFSYKVDVGCVDPCTNAFSNLQYAGESPIVLCPGYSTKFPFVGMTFTTLNVLNPAGTNVHQGGGSFYADGSGTYSALLQDTNGCQTTVTFEVTSCDFPLFYTCHAQYFEIYSKNSCASDVTVDVYFEGVQIVDDGFFPFLIGNSPQAWGTYDIVFDYTVGGIQCLYGTTNSITISNCPPATPCPGATIVPAGETLACPGDTINFAAFGISEAATMSVYGPTGLVATVSSPDGSGLTIPVVVSSGCHFGDYFAIVQVSTCEVTAALQVGLDNNCQHNCLWDMEAAIEVVDPDNGWEAWIAACPGEDLTFQINIDDSILPPDCTTLVWMVQESMWHCTNQALGYSASGTFDPSVSPQYVTIPGSYVFGCDATLGQKTQWFNLTIGCEDESGVVTANGACYNSDCAYNFPVDIFLSCTNATCNVDVSLPVSSKADCTNSTFTLPVTVTGGTGPYELYIEVNGPEVAVLYDGSHPGGTADITLTAPGSSGSYNLIALVTDTGVSNCNVGTSIPLTVTTNNCVDCDNCQPQFTSSCLESFAIAFTDGAQLDGTYKAGQTPCYSNLVVDIYFEGAPFILGVSAMPVVIPYNPNALGTYTFYSTYEVGGVSCSASNVVAVTNCPPTVPCEDIQIIPNGEKSRCIGDKITFEAFNASTAAVMYVFGPQGLDGIVTNSSGGDFEYEVILDGCDFGSWVVMVIDTDCTAVAYLEVSYEDSCSNDCDIEDAFELLDPVTGDDFWIGACPGEDLHMVLVIDPADLPPDCSNLIWHLQESMYHCEDQSLGYNSSGTAVPGTNIVTIPGSYVFSCDAQLGDKTQWFRFTLGCDDGNGCLDPECSVRVSLDLYLNCTSATCNVEVDPMPDVSACTNDLFTVTYNISAGTGPYEVKLEASGPQQMFFYDGPHIPGGQITAQAPTTPGVYQMILLVQDLSGSNCTDHALFTLTVTGDCGIVCDDPPNVILPGDGSYCNGDDITLEAWCLEAGQTWTVFGPGGAFQTVTGPACPAQITFSGLSECHAEVQFTSVITDTNDCEWTKELWAYLNPTNCPVCPNPPTISAPGVIYGCPSNSAGFFLPMSVSFGQCTSVEVEIVEAWIWGNLGGTANNIGTYPVTPGNNSVFIPWTAIQGVYGPGKVAWLYLTARCVEDCDCYSMTVVDVINNCSNGCVAFTVSTPSPVVCPGEQYTVSFGTSVPIGNLEVCIDGVSYGNSLNNITLTAPAVPGQHPYNVVILDLDQDPNQTCANPTCAGSMPMIVVVEQPQCVWIDSPPATVTYECPGDIGTIPSLTVSNTCGTNIEVIGTTQLISGTICEGTIRVTWNPKPDCDNLQPVTQDIHIDSDPLVVAGCVGVTTLTCNAAVPALKTLSDFTVSGGCNLQFTSSYVGGANWQNHPTDSCLEMVRMQYAITDDCGNNWSCTEQVQRPRVHTPVISNCPGNRSFDCDDRIFVPLTPTAFDCDGTAITPVYSESTTGNACDGYTVTRTWTFIGQCGGQAVCTQSDTVSGDGAAPTFDNCPADTNILCGGSIPAVPTVTASDDCDAAVAITYSATTNAGNCGSTNITRTWVATDNCGKSNVCVQSIVLAGASYVWDSTPPGNTNYQCLADVPAAAAVTISGCGSTLTVTPTQQSSGSCPTTITRTWTTVGLVPAGCEPTPASYTQIITVNDTIDPVLSGCPTQNPVIDCDDPIPAPANVTATDNCDGNLAVVYQATTNNGACGAKSITRFWTATDACGNVAVCSQTITVNGDTYTWQSTPPANITAQCSPPLAGALTAVSPCGADVSVFPVDSSDGNSCPETITRTWTATSIPIACRPAPFVQTIIVNDTIPPVLQGCPVGTSVPCNGTIPAPATVTATDNCGAVTPVYSATTNNGSCGAQTITRVWTATDTCGNVAACTQVITVAGASYTWQSAPPGPVTVQCDANVPAGSPLVLVSDCGANISVPFVDTDDGNTCPRVITRTWDATGLVPANCAPTPISVTQTITVDDTTDPVLSGCPANATIPCDRAIPAPATVTATDNCDGVLAVNYSAVTNQGACGAATITRSWTATDSCGNSATCSQTITVQGDNYTWQSAPPGPVTVQCDANVPAGSPLVLVSDCGANISVPFVDTDDGNTCPRVITRTWDATGLVPANCAPTPISVTQTITVDDTTDPVLSGCPANATIPCDRTIPAPAAVTATDNCDGVLAVNYSAVTNQGACGAATITRSWTATDSCGNSATCSQTITVQGDNYTWQSAPPGPVTVQCDANVPAGSPLVLVSDCGANISVPFVDTDDGNTCPRVITRTWDATGLVPANCAPTPISVTQTITVDDTTDPVLSGCPANATIPCDRAIPAPAAVTATDNCDGVLAVNYSAVTNQGACGAATITRSWTATDSCGNSATCSQTITVQGDNYTWQSAPPGPVTVQCDANVPAGSPLVLVSDCGANISVPFVDTDDGNTCPRVITRTWDATGLVPANCAPTPISVTQTITVDDTTDPVLSGCPANATIPCDRAIPAPAGVTATDNCDGVLAVNYSAVTNQGACGAATITRSWTATDSCGNSATCSQTITVQGDNYTWQSAPPGPVTVQCDANVPAGSPLVLVSDCGANISVPFVDTDDGNTCPRVITRTWDATGLVPANCAPTPISVTQTITVDDTTDPVLSGCPANATIPCDRAIPAPAAVTATDNCDGVLAVNYSAVTNQGACGAATITRSWTATDSCGNSATCSQTITVQGDNYTWQSAPPGPVTVQCDANVPAGSPLVLVSDCGANISVPFVDTDDGNTCPRVITRTWDATGLVPANCAPTPISVTQTITVDDTTDPVLSGCPANATIPCDRAIPAPAAVTATDNCDGVLAVNYSAVTNQGACGSGDHNPAAGTATDFVRQQRDVLADDNGAGRQLYLAVGPAGPGDGAVRCQCGPRVRRWYW